MTLMTTLINADPQRESALVMRERRATIRIGCFLPADYSRLNDPSTPALAQGRPERGEAESKDDSIVEEARVTNLSLGGLRFMARKAGAWGGRLRVRFTLPNEDELLSVNGIVRWSAHTPSRDGEYSQGLEFSGLDETTRFCLQAFIADQVRTSGRLGRVGRALSRLPQDLPTQFVTAIGLLMAGLVVAGLLVWVLMLQRKTVSLSQDVAARSLMVNQLEARRGQLLQELDQTKARLSDSRIEITHLQQQRAHLEAKIQWLSQNLGELKQAYRRVRDERERLRAQVVQLEHQQAAFAQRLQSVPELRKAIQQVRLSRRNQFRTQQARRIERLREVDRHDLESGNRGYVIRQGQPTLTSAHLSIRVYTPEPTR